MKQIGTTTLETDRLILRRFRLDDATAMYQNWANDPLVTQYLRWPACQRVEEVEETLRNWLQAYEDPSFYHWAIELRAIRQPIGSITIVDQDEKINKVHIGYCIGRSWWRQGIVTEAFRALIPFLFDTLGVNRIEAQHDPNNVNSGKVMEKCGLTYEGTMRQSDWNNQGIVDAAMYALLYQDWQAQKSSSQNK